MFTFRYGNTRVRSRINLSSRHFPGGPIANIVCFLYTLFIIPLTHERRDMCVNVSIFTYTNALFKLLFMKLIICNGYRV